MIASPMLKNAMVLGLFATLTTSMIATFHHFTSVQIEASQHQQLAASLNALISQDHYDNDLIHDTLMINDKALLHLDSPEILYRARKQGHDIAVIFPVIAPDGYSGKIKLLVAIYATGTLAGVQVLSDKETPGLGDAIEAEKSDWLTDFSARSLTLPNDAGWHVKKDKGIFDQFTGATITPRAVVKAVHNALLYYQQQQNQLFSAHTVSNTIESK